MLLKAGIGSSLHFEFGKKNDAPKAGEEKNFRETNIGECLYDSLKWHRGSSEPRATNTIAWSTSFVLSIPFLYASVITTSSLSLVFL